MGQGERKNRKSLRNRMEQRVSNERYGQTGRDRQRYESRSRAGEQSRTRQQSRTAQQNRTAQRAPEQRQSNPQRTTAGQTFQRHPPRPRGAARDWPDRLEVERKEQERKEQERKRQMKLKRMRKAKIRRRLFLCTAALFGIALFLAVRMVKNWNVQPEEKKKREEKETKVDIEELAAREEYPESLLKLLEKNPETEEFVLNYSKNKDKHRDIDISKEVKQGEIPLFLQWDERWGYETYGDDFLALTGCGPTCLSMVYCGLTGDSAWNPYRIARMAENSGYYVSGSGSAWDLMTQGASELGLTVEEMIFDEDHIRSTLEAGVPIICVVGPGDFTDSGHFLVLKGIDDQGHIILNDPNSKIRSRETWDINQLMSQIKNLWAYSYANAEGA